MYKFYIFLTILITCNCVFSSLLLNNEHLHETREKQLKVEAKCGKQMNLTEKARFPRLNDPELNPTPEYKAFLRCFADGMELLDKNKLQWDNLRRFLRVHDEKMLARMLQLEVVDFCQTSVVEVEDGTDNFFDVVKCLRVESLEQLSATDEFDAALNKEVPAIVNCLKKYSTNVYDEGLCEKLSDPNTTYKNGTKCLLKCLAEKMDLLSDNKVNWEAVKNLTMVHNRKNTEDLEIVKNCEKTVVQGESACENGFNLFKCLSLNPPKVFKDLQALYETNVRYQALQECENEPAERVLGFFPFTKVWDEKLETHEYKCYLKCVAEKMKLLRDGKFDWEKVRTFSELDPHFMNRKYFLEAYETCKGKVVEGEDLCESSFQLNNCMVDESYKVKDLLGVEPKMEQSAQ